MKNVRYIIGSLAIVAILYMNFRYAYHNYGIPKHKREACATTKPLGYSHVYVVTQKMCTFIEYRVEVHYRVHKEDPTKKDTCKHYITVTEFFRDFDRSKAYQAAKNYAETIYAPDYAVIDPFYTYVHAPYETYRIECANGGKLIDCTTEDATCPMCNSNS